MKPTLLVIQPFLTSYRIPWYRGLGDFFDTTVLYSSAPAGAGFGDHAPEDLPTVRYEFVRTVRPFGRLVGMYQVGVAAKIWRDRPQYVLIFGNPRFTSFWETLIVCRLLGVRLFIHGHGLVKHPSCGWPRLTMYSLILKGCHRYICYARAVRDDFVRRGFDTAKLRVASNSFVPGSTPSVGRPEVGARGILFIGRLRPRCGVTDLIEATAMLREEGLSLDLHILGDGPERLSLEQRWGGEGWVVFHGPTYDDTRVAEIAGECFVGCYPGSAGLSVVHLMSLGLPVIVHGDLSGHMGPEPSFVEDGVNGIHFDRREGRSGLARALSAAVTMRENGHLEDLNHAALETFRRLTNPSLAERVAKIIRLDSDEAE